MLHATPSLTALDELVGRFSLRRAAASTAAGLGGAPDLVEALASDSFEGMGLPEPVLRGVLDATIATPTPLQRVMIPQMLEGGDLCVRAPAGSGAATGLAIGILARVDATAPMCQAVVLCAHREEAMQFCRLLQELGRPAGVTVHLSVGGIRVQEEIARLAVPPHIVVGVPARVCLIALDVCELCLSGLQLLVIRHVDHIVPEHGEMLERLMASGAVPHDINVVAHTRRQQLPAGVDSFLMWLQTNPATITWARQSSPHPPATRHFVVVRSDADRMTVARSLMATAATSLLVVQLRVDVDAVVARLAASGTPTAAMYDGMSGDEQSEQCLLVEEGGVTVMVCTHAAVATCTFPPVQLVIHLHVPHRMEVWRRSAEVTAPSGRVVVCVSECEQRHLRLLAAMHQAPITELVRDDPVSHTLWRRRICSCTDATAIPPRCVDGRDPPRCDRCGGCRIEETEALR